jgi:hypothetical protein
LFSGLSWSHDTQTIGLRLRAALAVSREANHYITAIVTHVERMRMTLATITDHSDAFLLNEFQIRICIVINIRHTVSPLIK